jgi:hypothetical protein
MKEFIRLIREISIDLKIDIGEAFGLMEAYYNKTSEINLTESRYYSNEVGHVTNDFRDYIESRLSEIQVPEPIKNVGKVIESNSISPPKSLADTREVWKKIKSVSNFPRYAYTNDGNRYAVSTMTDEGLKRLKVILNTKLDGAYVDPAVLSVALNRQYNDPTSSKKVIMNYFKGDDWEQDYLLILKQTNEGTPINLDNGKSFTFTKDI